MCCSCFAPQNQSFAAWDGEPGSGHSSACRLRVPLATLKGQFETVSADGQDVQRGCASPDRVSTSMIGAGRLPYEFDRGRGHTQVSSLRCLGFGNDRRGNLALRRRAAVPKSSLRRSERLTSQAAAWTSPIFWCRSPLGACLAASPPLNAASHPTSAPVGSILPMIRSKKAGASCQTAQCLGGLYR